MRALVVACVLLGGCVYTPPADLAPKRTARALDGAYCFTTLAESTREQSRPGFTPSWIPLQSMREQSVVHVRQSADVLEVDYVDHDGVSRTVRIPAIRKNGGMEVELHSPGNPFGFFRSRAKMIVYRAPDAALVIRTFETHTGLSCGLVPYHERTESVFTLRAC